MEKSRGRKIKNSQSLQTKRHFTWHLMNKWSKLNYKCFPSPTTPKFKRSKILTWLTLRSMFNNLIFSSLQWSLHLFWVSQANKTARISLDRRSPPKPSAFQEDPDSTQCPPLPSYSFWLKMLKLFSTQNRVCSSLPKSRIKK